ncbi:hypothetical protein KC366_g15672, partial [Hortaea werneckii]
MADEDFFSDDDLDAVPDNTLAELEQNAISSTQRPPAEPLNGHVSIPSRPAHQAKQTAWRPPRPRAPPAAMAPQHRPDSDTPVTAPAPPSSDYGFEDEDVVDLDEPSMVIQPASGPNTRHPTQHAQHSSASARYNRKAALDPETEAAFAAADAELGTHEPGQWTHAPPLTSRASGPNSALDVSSLQARIAALEAEQNRLRQSEQDARNAAVAKQGEIAIVRANQEKAMRDYERRIAGMQKLHAEEAARAKTELEKWRKQREKLETEGRFLQHDLAQEAERARRTNGAGKGRTTASAAAAVRNRGQETPKRAKKNGLGDGFDDDEVRILSPSRSREKSRDATPKQGAKRKRTANDSPVTALSFAQPAASLRHEGSEQTQTPAEHHVAVVESTRTGDPYDFMQRLLHHSPYEGHDRSIETLTSHCFPSQPHRTFSSMLLDDLGRACLKLWSRCVDERYYAALYLLLDLIQFALFGQLSDIVAQLIEEAVPLCMTTISLVAIPLVRVSTNPAYAANLDREAHAKLCEQIDVDEMMEFLLRLAQSATIVGSTRVEDFWKCMELPFTLLMLNKAQPISQSTTTLRLLCTSSLSTTFGPVVPPESEDAASGQSKQETAIIDRLTILLFETPKPPPDEPAYSEAELAELRNEILSVFRELCLTDHGGHLLAQHRSAVGRLVRFLHGQMEKLHLLPPAASPSTHSPENLTTEQTTEPPSAHPLVAQTINTTTRLLYHLLRTYDTSLHLGQKLQAVQGGYHKFLVSMTRIAFSDQLVLEAGIEDEVAEAAHAVLDNMLSPEEGEAIGRAVETPRGTRGSGVGMVGVREEEGEGDGEDLILSMVPEGSHVRSVYLTPETGVLASPNLDSKILIDCSTIDTATSLAVRDACLTHHPQTRFYDAPVSGGVKGAEAGTLTFMLGIARTSPDLPLLTLLLTHLGAHINPCGGASLGLVAKLCNNYCSGLIAIATSEALNIGMASGMDPRVLANIFHTSTAQSAILDDFCPVPGLSPDAPASHGYAGGFRIGLMKKDFGLAVQTAKAVDQLPFNISEDTVEGDPDYIPPIFPIAPFTKYAGNPILSPNPANGWESAYLYNPTAIVLDETIFLLYRAQNASLTSSIGLAWSTDGYNFTRLNQPILYATEPWEAIGGTEDPRIVRINQTFFVTYTAYNNVTPQLCIASSEDLLTWRKTPPLFPGWQDVAYSDIDIPMPRLNHSKSGAIVREPTPDGLYHMYWGDSFLYHATSRDLTNWTTLPAEQYFAAPLLPWENRLIEPGPAPVQTRDGNWILFYNGMTTGRIGYPQNQYSTGQMLLDPTGSFRPNLRVPEGEYEPALRDGPLARVERPVLVPEGEEEESGQVDRVVFSEGL